MSYRITDELRMYKYDVVKLECRGEDGMWINVSLSDYELKCLIAACEECLKERG